MKPHASNPFRPHLFTLAALLAAPLAHAASGTWLGTSGDWGVAGTWSGGTLADGTGFTANFTGVDIMADQIINLDAARTIGNITFTDTTTSSNNLTISGANILTLDVASGASIIDVTQAARTLTISSQISGADGLQKNGLGTLILSGSNNYTNGTRVSAGVLSVNTIADSGTSAIGTAGTLFLSGGTLAFTGTAATTARAVTLTAASGLDVATSGTLTLNGAVSGGFNLTKTGDGKLVLGGTADNGDLRLNVSSGLVELNKTGIASNRAVAGIFAIANGATVKLTGTNGDQIFGGNVSSNYGIHGVAGTLDLNGKSESTSFLNGTSTGVVDGSSGTPLLTVGEQNVSSTFAGTIKNTTGTLGLTKIGSGTLTLSGNSSYSGVTAISGGILAISHSNALGNNTGNTTITATGGSGGPQLQLSGNINSPENITLNGTSDALNYNGAISNTSGTNTLSGNITLANPTGSIRITSNAGELILGGTISQTSTNRTLRLQALPGAFITVNNAIANNGGGLDILGSASGATGIVTLKAASTGIGNTNVNENGTLKLGISNAINPALSLTLGVAGTLAGFDFATLDLAGFNQTVAGLFGVKNTSNIGADNKRVVTNSAASGTSLLTVGNSNASSTFNGVILDGATAAVALTKIGTGTQTLVGDSNYSGVTTISVGTLAISHSNALGSTAGNTTIAATGNSNGGALSLSNGITSAENITITGLTEQAGGYNSAINSTSGVNTLSGNILLSSPTGGMRFGTTGASGSLTFSGNISQTGASQGLAFTASGGTTITVNNAIALNGGPLSIYSSGGVNSVTLKGVNGVGGIGNTVVSQSGTLKLGVSEALNTTGSLDIGVGTALTTDAGTFDLAGFNQTVNALNGTGTAATNSSRKVINSVAGTKTLTVGNGGGAGTFNGQINTGTGNIELIKTGVGNQTLNDVNTFTGGTRIDGGILTLGHATNTLADAGAVNVNGGTLALGTNTDTVGAVTLISGSITGTGAGKLTGTGSAFDVRSGTIDAKLGGTVGLTKTTGGIVTISSDNGIGGYTGATTISAGSLIVNGNITTSITTVSGTGTLGGNGTVGAVIVQAGGTLAPGNSIGTLNFNDTLSLAGIANFEIDPLLGLSVNADRANVTNGVTYGGTLNVMYGGLSSDFANGMIFNLFDAIMFSGSFSTVNLPTLTGGLTWQNDLLSNGTLTVVPEPRAALLGGLGMLALLRRRR